MSTPVTHQAGRALRATWLNASGRWHAWRAVRHHELSRQHQAALSRDATQARKVLAAR